MPYRSIVFYYAARSVLYSRQQNLLLGGDDSASHVPPVEPSSIAAEYKHSLAYVIAVTHAT